MRILSRFFGGEADVRRMRAFLSAARLDGSQPGYWHVGDLLWRLYQNTIFDPFTSLRLWEKDDGELLGFVCYSPLEWVDVQVHPRLRGNGLVEEQMLAWAEEYRLELPAKEDGTRSLQTGGLDIDPQRVAFLERHGFERILPVFLRLRQGLGKTLGAAGLQNFQRIFIILRQGNQEARLRGGSSGQIQFQLDACGWLALG